MHLKQINHKGKQLVYRLSGQGPAIVLLHGFGETGSIWDRQLQYLQNFYRVIVPDLPASGASDLTDDMSMEGLAESVHLLLQHESIERCILIGHSMGGYVTLAFAERYPQHLLGFGLFHSTAFADSQEKKETRQKGIKFIEQHGAFEFLKTSTPNLYSPATKETAFSLIEQHLSSVRHFSREALIAYSRAMINRPDRTHLLRQSTTPVLFVLGKYDTAVPLNDGLRQCYLPPIAHVQLLNRSGHMGMKEEPEKANELLHLYASATVRHPAVDYE